MKITIPDDCKKISVLFSGGMDSTALLYLLVTQHRDIPIKCYSMKVGVEEKVCPRILSWFSDHLQVDIPLQFLSRHPMLIRPTVETIQLIDPSYVYSGCNKVVTDQFTPTKYIKNDTPPVRGPALNSHHIRPFINIDKRDIVKIYYEYGILDLMELTFSCGSLEKQGKDFFPCGQCYFCMERAWALQSIINNTNL
jgi:hypothetical protein